MIRKQRQRRHSSSVWNRDSEKALGGVLPYAYFRLASRTSFQSSFCWKSQKIKACQRCQILAYPQPVLCNIVHVLFDCFYFILFHRTVLKSDWQMFCVAANGDSDEYTDSATAYISKCGNDVVPKVNVWTFPNQKPRVNGGVRAKLKALGSL